MARQNSMSLEDIRKGLGHMEQWCRLLRDAVEKYDAQTGNAALQLRDRRQIRKKKSACPPPDQEG